MSERRLLAIGDLVDGRFRIAKPLGEGGFGTVVAARDEREDCEVALKLVARATSAQALRWWQVESEAMRALAHPNVVRFVASGHHDDAVSYVAMDLVDGPSVAALLGGESALDVGSALAICVDVLSGLEAIHASGFVHRDVKPSNVVLARGNAEPRAVVVDFGLARATRVETSWSRPTRTGRVAGTPRYLAPERIEGAIGDARADVWSVGVLLYEMLAGRPPFASDTETRTMLQILASPVPELPVSLEHRALLTPLLARALEKSTARRAHSARELRDAILALPIPRGLACEDCWHRSSALAPSARTCTRET